MLYVVNFADRNYVQQQELNTRSAYEKGMVDKVIEFHEEDIMELKTQFPEHFKIKRGYGLWFWKPYLIMKAMDKANEGDYLFYCDSGAVFISDIHQLIPDFEASGKDMMVFEQPLLARAFTKGETYHLLGCSDYNGNQLLGGYIFLKKSEKSRRYMQEWHDAMTDIRVLSGEKFIPEFQDHKDYRQHREDQSVLTILCKEWGIEGHRDPSDCGMFPWLYMRAGGYNRKEYSNSTYPVILLCVRKTDPIKYEANYRKMLRLQKYGLYTEWWKRLTLIPMYCKHTGRIIADKLGMGTILNKLTRK